MISPAAALIGCASSLLADAPLQIVVEPWKQELDGHTQNYSRLNAAISGGQDAPRS